MEATDEELLAAWAQGDRKAGNQLTKRHFKPIYLYLRRRVPQFAEDLTQKTLLSVVERRGELKQTASFRAYALRIARTQMLMHLRHQRVVERQPAESPPSAITPSRVVALGREQKLLVRALESLEPGLQAICKLYYWEGLKAREVADVLEIPVSTVTTRLAKARSQLKSRIEEFGEDAPLVTTTVANLERWVTSLRDDSHDDR